MRVMDCRRLLETYPTPFAGMTRIRFCGFYLSPRWDTPVNDGKA